MNKKVIKVTAYLCKVSANFGGMKGNLSYDSKLSCTAGINFAKKITDAYICLKKTYQKKYREVVVQLKMTIQKLLSVAFYLLKHQMKETRTNCDGYNAENDE